MENIISPELYTEDYKWSLIRIRRNELLDKCIWTLLPDSNLTPEKVEEWVDYRQKLKDIPQDFLKADDVIFPEAPQ